MLTEYHEKYFPHKLERRQSKQWQDIFSVEEEIIEWRDALIEQLEKRTQQHTETTNLFTLRFSVI